MKWKQAQSRTQHIHDDKDSKPNQRIERLTQNPLNSINNGKWKKTVGN